MANIAIFRINYKSDFILTLNSDAGWMTPFCIKFWTGAPSQAYFVGFDGTTYTHCAPVAGEPTKLRVQFDDHHLPIGNLKYQIAYRFTVADFPNDTEDEVLNQANITTEIDGETYQVMLDFNGETAPEIQFALPAYANEAQRIANEEQRIAHEAIRIVNEESRIAAETIRQQNESQRIRQEEARVNEFATLKLQSQAATSAANTAAALANEKAALAADKAALAGAAATLANAKAQLAADKAALAASAAQLANDKAALAQQKAEYAQQQGDYAKAQGDTALADHRRAESDHTTAADDHTRAESDHGIAADDHTQAGNDHTRAESDHSTAASDHTQAGNDHTTAQSDHTTAGNDHTQAGNDHTRAESDHGIAADDHTQAGNDHTRAESDHTRAEQDHTDVQNAIEAADLVYDISKANAVGGVLATYADLSAALGVDGANVPVNRRQGGMTVKFVLTSDNKYVQYMLNAQNWTTDISCWEKINLEKELGNVETNYVRRSDYCDVSDYISTKITLDTVGFYNYKQTPVSYNSSNGFNCIKITGVLPGDIYKFTGSIKYESLAAVVFLDSQDNCIGYLYGDNTSATVSFDTGIFSIPHGCSSVVFNAYTGGQTIPILLKYSLPKTLTESAVEKTVIDIVNPDDDRIPNLVHVDAGHFYNAADLAYRTNSLYTCGVENVSYADKVSYYGKTLYDGVYAVMFADDSGIIIDRIGNGLGQISVVDTGIIPVPKGATKVYFNSYGNFSAYIYKQPAIVNEVSFQDFYAKGQNAVKYCNPYHYVMGISQPDDLVNSGFDVNFESSTVSSFLVHNKYFRSYRRKHEWFVILASTSVVRFGTGYRSDLIEVNSRMSQFVIDVPNSLLKIYSTEGSGVLKATVSLSAIDTSAEYILRYEQYDYVMNISVINYATLEVVASYTNTATPADSPLGKLIGRPFIELQAGSLKVTRYDCYLMDKPKVIFIGDSITECGYKQDSYAAMLIRENLNNNGCIIAQGGANSDVLGFNRASEISFMKPEYLSLLAGTNGGLTVAQINGWKNYCENEGIRFILNCVPVSLDEEHYPWATKNAIIRSQGILGANFDYATALNNDPDDGANPALFETDRVHPNADGQKAMYERFLNDVRLFN